MKFHIKKVKNSSFLGTVSDDSLPKKYQDLLDVDLNQEFSNEILFEGDYSIQWDDDIPMPVIETLFLDNGNKYIEVNLADIGNEVYSLEEEISQSGWDCDWYADRYAELVDRAIDDYKDREQGDN